MPSLIGRKKKSYIPRDGAMSVERRDLIKRKLYADYMVDDDDEYDYLNTQLSSSTRPISVHTGRGPSRPRNPTRTHSISTANERRGSVARAHELGGPLRQPVRRSYSDSESFTNECQPQEKPLHRPYREPILVEAPIQRRSFSRGNRRLSMSGNVLESAVPREKPQRRTSITPAYEPEETRGRSASRRPISTRTTSLDGGPREKPKRRTSITPAYDPPEAPQLNVTINPPRRNRSLSIGRLSAARHSEPHEKPKRRVSIVPSYPSEEPEAAAAPRRRRRSLSIGAMGPAAAIETEPPSESNATEKPKRRFSLSPGRFRRKTNSTRASRKAAREQQTEYCDETSSASSSPRLRYRKSPRSPRSPRPTSSYHDHSDDASSVSSWNSSLCQSIGKARSSEETIATSSMTRYSRKSDISVDSHSSWDTASQNSSIARSPSIHSGGEDNGGRSREAIYNSALKRANQRQALKQHILKNNANKNHPHIASSTCGETMVSVHHDSEGETDDEREGDAQHKRTESEDKTILGRLLGAVESMYEECS